MCVHFVSCHAICLLLSFFVIYVSHTNEHGQNGEHKEVAQEADTLATRDVRQCLWKSVAPSLFWLPVCDEHTGSSDWTRVHSLAVYLLVISFTSFTIVENIYSSDHGLSGMPIKSPYQNYLFSFVVSFFLIIQCTCLCNLHTTTSFPFCACSQTFLTTWSNQRLVVLPRCCLVVSAMIEQKGKIFWILAFWAIDTRDLEN